MRRLVDWLYDALEPDAAAAAAAGQDLYVSAGLAAALCAGQELAAEAGGGKKRRGRKSKWTCEACGQKKPKKVREGCTNYKALATGQHCQQSFKLSTAQGY